VLAGGRGTRIGGPKALVQLGGRALIEFPLTALGDAQIETVVVAKPDSELPALDVPVWQEPAEPVHPLLGVVTALRRSEGRPLIVCACDMPFAPASLFEHLAGLDLPLAVPTLGDRLQPLLARYDAALLDELEQALVAERSMHEAISALDPYLIEAAELARFGDPQRLLLNVNTAADLARAEALL
jgi:molybdopterin-guanine dinucleotide biosynthesis protein A